MRAWKQGPCPLIWKSSYAYPHLTCSWLNELTRDTLPELYVAAKTTLVSCGLQSQEAEEVGTSV